ncbi:MAG: hypothetical protein ACI3W7_07740 [Oscillospiraceae bacterium]
MKISDLLDVIEDDSVSIRENEIIAPERIKEVTMSKIHADMATNRTVGKKLRKGAIAIAAACLTLSVTAFAAGMMGRLINWQGNTIGGVQQPLETEKPIVSEEYAAGREHIQSILDSSSNDVLVLVKYTDENGVTDIRSNDRTREFSSADELSKALSDAGSELRVFDAPAGYEFISAQVTYDCAAGYEYTLVSAETDVNGFTVEKYTIPDEGNILSGYVVEYQDSDGNRLYIDGRLSDGDASFITDEDETVKSISVEGIDSALIFEQRDGGSVAAATIEMSKALTSPVAYVSKAALTGAQPTEGGDVFSKAWYSIHASGLDADMLFEILAF